jgi:hypothetical protein
LLTIENNEMGQWDAHVPGWRLLSLFTGPRTRSHHAFTSPHHFIDPTGNLVGERWDSNPGDYHDEQS